jgi:hypothetical protein
MQMRKAQRKKAKLRLALSGPAGSGKTFGALLIAYGITDDWEKICLIDTENGSGELYANYNQGGVEIGEYNIITLESPYAPDKYMAAIKECERAGIKVVIIDSLTHAWAGEGGLLDRKGQIEKSGKPGVNSWTAWRDITPMHNRLVESILTSSCHVITTLRAKMDYVQEKDPNTGKNIVRKVGMNPIQRDGMEYEFTVFLDISQDHQATSSKDRTSLFDGKVFVPGVDTGRQLLRWLELGTEETAPKPEQPKPQPQPQNESAAKASEPVKATPAQIKAIWTCAQAQNVTAEQLKAIIADKYGIESSKELTKDQASELIDYLGGVK